MHLGLICCEVIASQQKLHTMTLSFDDLDIPEKLILILQHFPMYAVLQQRGEVEWFSSMILVLAVTIFDLLF